MTWSDSSWRFACGDVFIVCQECRWREPYFPSYGDDDAPLETLGCCRWQRREWSGQCRGNRRRSAVGRIWWEGGKFAAILKLISMDQTGFKQNSDISLKSRHRVKIEEGIINFFIKWFSVFPATSFQEDWSLSCFF